MSLRPPRCAVLLAILLVLVPVAAAGTAPAAVTPGPDEAADRAPPSGSLGTGQSDVTVLNVTVVGRTAVDAGAPTMTNVSRTVATELDLDPARVSVDRTEDTVEVRANRSGDAIRAALREAGVDTADVEVREGVSNATRDAVAAALRDRIAAAGLEANTSVAVVGDSRLRIRTTAVSSVRSTVAVRGDVAIVGGFPGSDAPRRVELVDASGIATVGSVEVRPGGAPYVPVALTDAAARNFSSTLVDNGFTDDANTSSCRYDETPTEPGYCLFTVVDGEVVYAASLSPSLADIVRDGEFVEDPRFVVTAANRSTARQLATTLRTGPLPAPVRVVNTTAASTSPFETPGPGSVASTSTPSPTPTADGGGTEETPTADDGDTATAADGTAASDDGTPDGTSDAGGPGFGVAAALTALLALAAGLARRRQSP